ncbi:MAG: hypothetical protein NT172_00030 [Planctomycetota bacterium]|nr:hypothetical protein [Planctomycetota bacterium]
MAANSLEFEMTYSLQAAVGLISFTEADFDTVVHEDLAHYSYLGRGESREFISEVKRWRRFFRPCAMYGYRLNPSTSIVSRYPYFNHDDFFTVDGNGVGRNAVIAPDTHVRVQAARSRGAPVFGFFGGSTIQGFGARLPQFSIPAQIEKIFKLRHGLDVVCINYGVAGWTCSDSLLLLIQEAGLNLDAAFFYDGWNCCYDFYLRTIAPRFVSDHTPIPHPFPGTSFRHMEIDYIASLHFSAGYLGRRAVQLMINRCLTWVADRLPYKSVRCFLDFVLRRYFSLADNVLLRNRLNSYVVQPNEEEAITESAVTDYLATHKKLSRCCQAEGLRFWHVYQPILANSNKPLHPCEVEFSKTGLPAGPINVSQIFRKLVNRDEHEIIDFSDIFDFSPQQMFVDAGHLNAKGNFQVALRLSDLIARDLNKDGR